MSQPEIARHLFFSLLSSEIWTTWDSLLLHVALLTSLSFSVVCITAMDNGRYHLGGHIGNIEVGSIASDSKIDMCVLHKGFYCEWSTGSQYGGSSLLETLFPVHKLFLVALHLCLLWSVAFWDRPLCHSTSSLSGLRATMTGEFDLGRSLSFSSSDSWQLLNS